MADLTVKLSEDLILNNTQYGAFHEFVITGIREAFKRLVSCINGHPTTIGVFDTETRTSPGAIKIGEVKYVRLTNMSSTESIEASFVGEATLYQVTIAPLQSHVLGAANDLLLAEADTSPSFGTMTDLKSISVQPTGSQPVDVEIFVASL